jgi:hypothetical protein
MSREDAARRMVAEACGTEFGGIAVVMSSSPLLNRIPNRRAQTQRKELLRLNRLAGEVMQMLIDGVEVDTARQAVRTAGFEDCLTITSNREQLVEAVRARFERGDNVADGGTVIGRVAKIALWYDRSHRCVF